MNNLFFNSLNIIILIKEKKEMKWMLVNKQLYIEIRIHILN